MQILEEDFTVIGFSVSLKDFFSSIFSKKEEKMKVEYPAVEQNILIPISYGMLLAVILGISIADFFFANLSLNTFIGFISVFLFGGLYCFFDREYFKDYPKLSITVLLTCIFALVNDFFRNYVI